MSTQIHSNLDLQNSSKVVNVPTPTAPGDAVSKSYADGLTGAGEIAASSLVLAASFSLSVNKGAVIPKMLQVGAGLVLTLGSGAVLRIH